MKKEVNARCALPFRISYSFYIRVPAQDPAPISRTVSGYNPAEVTVRTSAAIDYCWFSLPVDELPPAVLLSVICSIMSLPF